MSLAERHARRALRAKALARCCLLWADRADCVYTLESGEWLVRCDYHRGYHPAPPGDMADFCPCEQERSRLPPTP